MKVVLILALIVFAGNSITIDNPSNNGTLGTPNKTTPVNTENTGNTDTFGSAEIFFQALSQRLGLPEKFDDANTCLEGLGKLVGQLQELIENSQDVETMTFAFLLFYQDAQSQVEVYCGTFALDIMSVLSQNIETTEGNQTTNFETVVQANWETYFPQIIQKIGEAVNQLVTGDAFGAGDTVGYIIQVLSGIEKPQALSSTSRVVPGKYVAFNLKKFVSGFFDTFARTLGVSSDNSKGILSCVTLVQTLNTEYATFVAAVAGLDFFDRLDKGADFYGKVVDTVKGCTVAMNAGNLTIGRIYRTIKKNSGQILYQIFLNTLLNFPTFQQSIELEATYIMQGLYDLAGKTDAIRVKAMLNGIVDFGTAESN
jgi:hypothetical protein